MVSDILDHPVCIRETQTGENSHIATSFLIPSHVDEYIYDRILWHSSFAEPDWIKRCQCLLKRIFQNNPDITSLKDHVEPDQLASDEAI